MRTSHSDQVDEYIAELEAEVERLKGSYETCHASRLHAEKALDRVERERDEALRTAQGEENLRLMVMAERDDLEAKVERLRAELVSACDDLKKLGHNDCATRHEEALREGRE